MIAKRVSSDAIPKNSERWSWGDVRRQTVPYIWSVLLRHSVYVWFDRRWRHLRLSDGDLYGERKETTSTIRIDNRRRARPHHRLDWSMSSGSNFYSTPHHASPDRVIFSAKCHKMHRCAAVVLRCTCRGVRKIFFIRGGGGNLAPC